MYFVDILAKTGMGLGAYIEIISTSGSGIDVSNLLCHVGFLNGCLQALCFYIPSLGMLFVTQHWHLTITQQAHVQECRKNVFAVSQARIHHSLPVFNKSVAILQSVFAKPNLLSLAVPVVHLFSASDMHTSQFISFPGQLNICFCCCSTDDGNEAGEGSLVIEWSVIVHFRS